MNTTRSTRVRTAATALLALTVVVLGVSRVSTAGFSGNTDSPGQNWSSGTVALTNDRVGSAMFSTATDGLLDGGQSLTKCIAVTYTGTITDDIRVRMSGTTAGVLAPLLDVTVEEGTGGGGTSCTGFARVRTLYDGTLSGFSAPHNTFAAWTPTGTPETRTYRVTTTVQNVTAAQNQAATATFTWDATSDANAAPAADMKNNATEITLAGAPAQITGPALRTAASGIVGPVASTPGADTIVDFDLTGATYEQFEIDNWIAELGDNGGGSIWFSLTPDRNTRLQLSTFPGQDMPDAACYTTLGIYEGANIEDWEWGQWGGVSADNNWTGDPDQTCEQQPRIVTDVVAGQQYLINVQGVTPADLKAGRLRVRELPGVVNDNLADAIALPALTSGQAHTFHPDLYQATSEPNEDSTDSTVWYTYTPTQNQSITLNLEHGTPWPWLKPMSALYTGGPGHLNLTRIETSDWSTVTGRPLNLIAGTTYHLRLSLRIFNQVQPQYRITAS